MGIRCDQYVGLTQEADDFLRENAVMEKANPCPHCGEYLNEVMKLEPHDKYCGMFESKYNLFKHPLKDGGYALERLQAEPWSSGPMFFISLEVYLADGQLRQTIQWTNKEINMETGCTEEEADAIEAAEAAGE